MTNLTLAIPEELSRKMKLFKEIRWSEIARQAIEKRIQDLEFMNQIASKSKLTEKDALELGRLIKKGSYENFKKKGLI
ncbi:MAG: hypothetical protein PHH00_04115 [Candidatus Nanoarchaeia archaeon]|nr:hypothetical protein [Candidatus Nanoarchaeia archaeon]